MLRHDDESAGATVEQLNVALVCSHKGDSGIIDVTQTLLEVVLGPDTNADVMKESHCL
jgi:hypothetical protein